MIPPPTPLTPSFPPAGCFFFLVTVTFLHSPTDRGVITGNCQKIAIRKLTPVLLQLSREMLPTPFELVLVHKFNLLIGDVTGGGGQLLHLPPGVEVLVNDVQL